MDIGAFESEGFTLTPVTGSTPQSAVVNTAFSNPLTVTVAANNPMEPVNGGVVTFTAPASGASSRLSAATVTISSGRASVIATANSTPGGPYTVAATAAGVATGASFSLTNSSPLMIASIAAVPPNPRNTAVSSIDVTFNEPVNLGTFTGSGLTLTENGGPNLITSAVSVSLISGSSYQINGLAGLTASNGNYTLTVNAAGIRDRYGNPGTDSLSTSWLMDTTPPTSRVSRASQARDQPHALPSRSPAPMEDNPPSGVASYDIYASTNGGPVGVLDHVPASSPTASFTGQSNTIYAFYSIAHDLAGNTESQDAVDRGQHLPARPHPAGHLGRRHDRDQPQLGQPGHRHLHARL